MPSLMVSLSLWIAYEICFPWSSRSGAVVVLTASLPARTFVRLPDLKDWVCTVLPVSLNQAQNLLRRLLFGHPRHLPPNGTDRALERIQKVGPLSHETLILVISFVLSFFEGVTPCSRLFRKDLSSSTAGSLCCGTKPSSCPLCSSDL